MIGLLVNFVILLLILAILFLIIRLIIQVTGFPLDMNIVHIIFLIIILLWFVGYFAGSIPAWRFRD